MCQSWSVLFSRSLRNFDTWDRWPTARKVEEVTVVVISAAMEKVMEKVVDLVAMAKAKAVAVVVEGLAVVVEGSKEEGTSREASRGAGKADVMH